MGAGIFLTMASSNSSMPIPFLADTDNASVASKPITSSISLFTLSTSAPIYLNFNLLKVKYELLIAYQVNLFYLVLELFPSYYPVPNAHLPGSVLRFPVLHL